MFSFLAIQAISFLSIPIFTKLLSPADFGIYEVFNNTVRFLTVIISLNLYTGFYRYYFEDKALKQELMQFLLRLSFIVFVLFAILLFLFKPYLMSLANLPNDVFIWIIISIFSSIALNFFTTYNNAQQFSTRAGIWQLVIQILKVIFSVIFILFFSKNYLGRIVGENGIVFIITLIVIVIYFRKYVGWSEKLTNKKEIIKYSTGFIPIGLSSYIISYIDLLLINNIQGNTASGVYSYAYKFAIVFAGFSQAFVTANRPELFNLLQENKEQAVIEQMRSMFKLITVMACVFILFASDAGKILSFKKEFEEALYLLPILIIGYVFSEMAEIYNFFLYHSKKVKLFYVSFAVTAVINFVLNLILIPKYGYEIAAYTTVVSYCFLFLATYVVSKFYTNLSVPRWTIYADYLLIIFTTAILGYVINRYIDSIYIVVLLKLILLSIAIIYIFYSKIINLIKTRSSQSLTLFKKE